MKEKTKWFLVLVVKRHHCANGLFGKNFVILNRWTSKVQPGCRLLKHCQKKTWGWGWVVLVVTIKWQNCRGTFYSFHGEIMSKNITRTARRQLDGEHLLFGVYLQTWADLNLLNFPIKMHYRYELTLTEVSMSWLVFKLGIIIIILWMNNKTIIEFGFHRIWRILQCITPYSICRIFWPRLILNFLCPLALIHD